MFRLFIKLRTKNKEWVFAALRALVILGSLTRRGAARPAAHRSHAAHKEKPAKILFGKNPRKCYIFFELNYATECRM
jgi:hypothetical protein